MVSDHERGQGCPVDGRRHSRSGKAQGFHGCALVSSHRGRPRLSRPRFAGKAAPGSRRAEELPLSTRRVLCGTAGERERRGRVKTESESAVESARGKRRVYCALMLSAIEREGGERERQRERKRERWRGGDGVRGWDGRRAGDGSEVGLEVRRGGAALDAFPGSPVFSCLWALALAFGM